MISLIEKLIDKLSLSFLNRTNSPSIKSVQKNVSGDNVAGDKHVHYGSESEKKLLNVVCAWSIPEQHQENYKIIVYEFNPTLLNKSDEIIKDLWINFSSSGFNLEIETTKHTNLFEGWNVHDHALNLVTKAEYRYAPQNLLYPFKIRIVLKKELVPNDAWLYLSFGGPNVKKFEIEAKVTKEALKAFIAGQDHSAQVFLKFLGLAK